MRYKEIVEDGPGKQPEDPEVRRERLRAKAMKKGYDLAAAGPKAEEIVSRAEQQPERQLVLTKKNRHLLRRWLLGADEDAFLRTIEDDLIETRQRILA